MTVTERTEGRRVELWTREGLPGPTARRRERLMERLRALEDTGAVDRVDVSSWAKRIECAGPSDVNARDRYLAFRRWAADRGLQMRPFFGTRTCYSAETGERSDWLVFPALCLAVYDDDDLVAVYPHADGATARSVTDGLAALADARDSAGERDRAPVGTIN